MVERRDGQAVGMPCENHGIEDQGQDTPPAPYSMVAPTKRDRLPWHDTSISRPARPG